jgi:hypothetical protein
MVARPDHLGRSAAQANWATQPTTADPTTATGRHDHTHTRRAHHRRTTE